MTSSDNMKRHWGEGVDTVMGVDEAATGHHLYDTTGAKQHDSLLLSDSGRGYSTPSHAKQTIRKRALRRAHKRLNTNGFTWYRGQLWTSAPSFITEAQPTPSNDTPRWTLTTQPCEHVPRRRLQILHWNAGALSRSKYQEILHWCSINWIDVAVLTETHWTMDEEWITDRFHIIHSGFSTPQSFDRSSGIMVAISKKLCEAHQIAWTSIYPGRLLHCKIHCNSRPIDIIGIYQYVWTGSVMQTQRRQQLWELTHKTLDDLAKRNTLCFLGDFNCSLRAIPRLVGTDHYVDQAGLKMRGPQHGDQFRFAQLIKDLNLVGLNTWNATLGATFQNTLGRSSRIDFVFTRIFTDDTQARQVGYLRNAPFLAGGPHHVPLLVTLGHRICRHTRTAKTGLSFSTKTQCINESRAESVRWQGCMETINKELRTRTVHSLEQLSDILIQGTLQHYSPTTTVRGDKVPGSLQMKWYHFRQAKTPGVTTLRMVLQKWFHVCKFQYYDRLHARQVNQYKRQQLHEMTQEAAHAHEQHDSYRLFKIVNRYCPKQRLKRIRLKNDDGHFMTPVEETAEYCRYISETWSGPQLTPKSTKPPGVPFTLDELMRELENIPSTKAVAPIFAPGVVWKGQAHYLGQWIFTHLGNWWNLSTPYIPKVWRDGWVTFLPKPQKASTRVSNLRVLALQEPIGKCIIKLLTKKASQQCTSELVRHPQYAYLPYRSTRDALLRVAAHCNVVRNLIDSQKRSIHVPRNLQPRLDCCGGLQIFLDLHKAFDMLPRPLIQMALESLPLSDSLLSLLTHWHLDTSYHITTNNSTRCIPVSRGVRQGCCAAPFIWSSVIVYVLTQLADHIPLEWLHQCLTVFADDFHIACTFRSVDQLHQAWRYIGIVLDTLTKLGFQLNTSKSKILIKGSGSKFHHWKKQHIDTTQHCTLKITTDSNTYQLPRGKTHLYLGCMMSYEQFEMQSLKVRVATGWHQFRRLQKWLCGKKTHISLRLRILHTCVFPCVTYGLLYIGLTVPGLHQLCTQITAMYRRVCGNMAHVTGITHADFFHRYQLRSPIAIVGELWQQAVAGLQNARDQMPDSDIIQQTPWTTLFSSRTTIERIGSGPVRQLLPPQVLSCEYCDATFSHPNLLQRHMTRNHQKPRQAVRRLDIQMDSQDGKAICQHCHKSFTNWRTFKYHVQYQVCTQGSYVTHMNPAHPVDDSDDQAQSAPPLPSNSRDLGDRAYAIAQSGDYELAKEDQAMCLYLTQHCVLCNKFMSSSKAYTAHMRHYHQAALQDAISLGLQRCKQYNALTSPCQFCHTEFTRAHMCVVCTQLAVLEVQHTSAANTHQCYICSFTADDRTSLRRHLSHVHQFSVFDWKPSRDSKEDQQTCAHCDSTHHSLEALRKHIIYGHCTQFDPDRAWTRCGDTDIHELFRQGNFKAIFADADMRQRLTLTCQYCKDSYQMGKHMAQHVYVHHGELVQQADMLCQWLKAVFLPTYGCTCNPSVKKLNQTHVCLPFLQLAMMHYQRGDWICPPIIYTEAVRDSMITHIPINSILHVCDCLREFQQLFQDPGLRQALRTSCLCCGKALTLAGPSAERNLDYHLRRDHPEPSQAIQTLIDMVQEFHHNDSEQTCEWCLADITTTAIDGDLSSHLSECGVLRNLLTWLCLPLVAHGDGTTRSTHGSTGIVGRGLGSQKRPPPETPKRPLTISALFQRQQLQRHYQDDSVDGDPTASPRKRPCSTTEPRQLHPFPTHGTGWDHFKHPEPIFGVEEERQAREHVSFAPAPAALHPHPDPRAPSQDPELQERGQASGSQHQVTTATGRYELAFSSMVSSEEGAGDKWKTTINPDGGDDSKRDDSHGTLQTGGNSGQISLPETSAKPGQGHSLEARLGHETSRSARAPQEACTIESLAASVHEDQAALPSTGKNCGSIAADASTQGQEERMIHQVNLCLQTITLINQDVACYINSTCWTVCWVHLLCTRQSMMEWLHSGSTCMNFLQDGPDQEINLKHHASMGDGMMQWNQLRRGGQQDLSEFLTFLLGWLDTKMVSMGYERRFLTESGVQTAEKGDLHSPITLAADFWQHLSSPLSVELILDNWMNQHGMQTALTIASPLLCWQVCRFKDIGEPDLRPLDLGNLSFRVAAFTGQNMACAKIPYTIIAVVTYEGTSMQGHYQCAVHLNDHLLLMNDNVKPRLHKMLPEWFLRGISHIWMVRTDLHRQLDAVIREDEVQMAREELQALLKA